MKTALVCIAKNEDFYIDEWMDYHFKLGFDDIFIYANDWNYYTDKKKVYVITMNGKRMQWNAYNNFIEIYNNQYNWAAFFDVDEFLVLHKHNNIKELLNDYSDCNAIGINWAIFGNNGHTEIINNNYNVLSRFTKRNKETYIFNKHIKTIVKLPSYVLQDIHCVSGYWYNLNKEKKTGPFNQPVDWKIAQINHYMTKSDTELLLKIDRGRADAYTKKQLQDCKGPLASNQVEDLTALTFYNSDLKY